MTRGAFTWYDLATPDAEGAKRFYTAVMGWTANEIEMAGASFTMFLADGKPVAGMRALRDLPAGTQPGWTGYVAVDDVEAVAGTLKDAGGTMDTGIEDMGGQKFVRARDPHGARFAFVQAGPHDARAAAMDMAPGHVAWHELLADDGEEAFGFYSGLFGWTRGEGLDMGPLGVYQMFDVGNRSIGGMMTRVPDMPAATWTFYVATDGIDAAHARVTAAGGAVVFGPQEVPGGLWIINVIDPQGVMTALVAPGR
jgi:uncharacterized protein